MFQFFCVVCESLKFEGRSAVCSYCRDKVENRKKQFHLRFQGLTPHYYLFKWNDETDVFCRNLVYYLKNQNPSVFDEWVKLFPSEVDVDSLKAIAAVPKASNSGINHARSFADELKKPLGFSCVKEVECCASEAPQKAKTRSQRFKADLKGFQEPLLYKKWVFVDDVLVSGATFGMIKRVFARPPEAIFTLFYRPYLKEGMI